MNDQPLSGATSWDEWRFQFLPSGVLRSIGTKGHREPNCAKCGEPIRWSLDMFSFTTGDDHLLAHARCVWTRDAFLRELEATKGSSTSDDTRSDRDGRA